MKLLEDFKCIKETDSKDADAKLSFVLDGQVIAETTTSPKRISEFLRQCTIDDGQVTALDDGTECAWKIKAYAESAKLVMNQHPDFEDIDKIIALMDAIIEYADKSYSLLDEYLLNSIHVKRLGATEQKEM